MGVLELLSSLLIAAGVFFIFSGTLGVLRFPDFYTRLHGAGVTDTLGASLVLIGLMLRAGADLVVFKLLMILLFIMITSPTACHALSKAARRSGVRPVGSESGQRATEEVVLADIAVGPTRHAGLFEE